MRASLESIRNQTFTDFECIVVDESSNLELASACRDVCSEDPRFIYIHPIERLGLANSLNLAISRARGQFIARFDSDDICVPQRLELQVDFLLGHPEISVVGGGMDIISTDGNFIAHRSYPQFSIDLVKSMQFTNAIAHPTVMYRKDAIDRYGGYKPYLFCEDLDLWLRWMNSGLLFYNLPQVLVHYRQDSTLRDTLNWRFNLRVRISNFKAQYFFRRVFGILSISLWVAIPQKLKEQIYKLLVLRS